MASVRQGLVDAIKVVVGDTAVVVGADDSVDARGKMTIVVRQKRLSHLPEAPGGAMLIDFTLSITSPAVDAAQAEDDLDEFVPSFLDDMRPHAWFGWTEATKGTETGAMGYEVEAQVIGTPTGQEQS